MYLLADNTLFTPDTDRHVRTHISIRKPCLIVFRVGWNSELFFTIDIVKRTNRTQLDFEAKLKPPVGRYTFVVFRTCFEKCYDHRGGDTGLCRKPRTSTDVTYVRDFVTGKRVTSMYTRRSFLRDLSKSVCVHDRKPYVARSLHRAGRVLECRRDKCT